MLETCLRSGTDIAFGPKQTAHHLTIGSAWARN